MICIEGDQQHLLCVYREQSVRSPREARMLLQQGCWNDEPPSGAVSSFLRAVRTGFGDTFTAARYSAGRIVLSSRNVSAVAGAQQLADYHGLSYFDGRTTRAQLTDPTLLALFRCCSVLRDPTARALIWKAEGFRMFMARADEDGQVDVTAHVEGDCSALRLLGFSKRHGQRAWHRRTTSHFLPPLYERMLQTLALGELTWSVVVTSMPHVVLAPTMEDYLAPGMPYL